MIIKLSFLDSQGKTKNKVFKRQPGHGIQAVKSQFIKYDRWKSCDFHLYYINQQGREVIIDDDTQLEAYLREYKDSPKIWANQTGKRKSDLHEFQLLKISQIRVEEGSQISDSGFGVPCESFIINRNQTPLIIKEKEQKHSYQLREPLYSNSYQQNDLFRGVMKKNMHMGVHCANCQKKNIQGVRYQCLLCFAFNLCENCQASPDFQHEHPLLKLNRQQKEFSLSQLQQLRDNISSQLHSERDQFRLDQTESYLKQIRQLTSNYEFLLSQNQMLVHQNEENQDTIRKQRDRIQRLEKQLRKAIQQQQGNGFHNRFQPCELFEQIGKKIKTIIKDKPAQRHRQRTSNNLKGRPSLSQQQQQSSEQSIIIKAEAITKKVGLDFSESLQFARQFPSMRAEELINKIMR